MQGIKDLTKSQFTFTGVLISP